jgi:hypothetical protein
MAGNVTFARRILRKHDAACGGQAEEAGNSCEKHPGGIADGAG